MSQTRRNLACTRYASRSVLPEFLSLLLLGFVLLLMLPSNARAAQGAPSPDTTVHQANGPGAQLARETRETAGEDENAEFKHSPAILAISRITRLSPEEAYWLCMVLNFGIVAGTIVWISKKKLPTAFRNRTLSIQRAMQEARRASQEANLRLAEIESRLSRLDGEIARMQATAETEAIAEEARIKAAAHEDARRIVESAEQEIAAATKAARRELTVYAADLAVNLAERQANVDMSTDQGLVRKFAQQLAADGAAREGRS
jgi:F-type H+-transporting ATPase subunit b